MLSEIIKYAQCMNCQPDVFDWINKHLTPYLEKNNGDQIEVEHIIDYLASDKRPNRLAKMSYEQAKSNTDKWNKALIKKGSGIKELETDTQLIKDFGDGFKIVKLIGENAYKREGFLMRHCVSDYFGRDKEVYSLRDKENMPHATLEKDQQIKGKGNGSISPKYIGYIVAFSEEVGMMVGDSEMKNLGYINVAKIKNKLHPEKNKFYKDYLYENDIWLNKDGEEYQELDLLDFKELISETSTANSEFSLKINFNLSIFLKKAISNIFSSTKEIGSGNYSKNASSGNYSQNASSGNYSQNASSGNYSQNASSGDRSRNVSSGNYSKNASSGDDSRNVSSGYGSQNASSGNYSKNASSGDDSKNVSSGYGSQNASSGNYSKNASSGDDSRNVSSGYGSQNASSGNYSKNASSGDDSKNVSSGDDSQNASSGDDSKNVSSGDDSQNASSGNYSKNVSSGDRSRNVSSGYGSRNASSGKNCVLMACHHESKVKGSIGTLVALVLHKKEGDYWIPKKIVTGEVGKEGLEPDVWYGLDEEGKFVEVKDA